MHIVEPDPDGIIADRIDGKNGHITFAANRLALGFGMALHFGGGTGHPEQFGGEIERLAVVKGDPQRAAVFRQANFDRPRHRHVRCAHAALQPRSPRTDKVVAANTRAATKTFMALPRILTRPAHSAATVRGASPEAARACSSSTQSE